MGDAACDLTGGVGPVGAGKEGGGPEGGGPDGGGPVGGPRGRSVGLAWGVGTGRGAPG